MLHELLYRADEAERAERAGSAERDLIRPGAAVAHLLEDLSHPLRPLFTSGNVVDFSVEEPIGSRFTISTDFMPSLPATAAVIRTWCEGVPPQVTSASA